VRYLNRETADAVGHMLLAENFRSVNHRYAEANEPEGFFAYRRSLQGCNPVVILKAIDCYEYQTCEHPEWEQSEAHAFCQALRKRMISMLPGYEDAPWGL